MFYVLGQNFKLFLKGLLVFLSIVFVEFLIFCFPKHIMIVWLFKISVVIFVALKWAKKIKKQSKLKFFTPSFKCRGIHWSIMIIFTVLRNEVFGIFMFSSSICWIISMVLFYKAVNDSLTVIRKYDPKIKMDTKVSSPDDYFELYSRAENLDMEISELKKETPPAVVEAIMQREAGKLIPFFHLEMMYLEVLILCGTPWIPVGV